MADVAGAERQSASEAAECHKLTFCHSGTRNVAECKATRLRTVSETLQAPSASTGMYLYALMRIRSRRVRLFVSQL